MNKHSNKLKDTPAESNLTELKGIELKLPTHANSINLWTKANKQMDLEVEIMKYKSLLKRPFYKLKFFYIFF